MLTEKNLIRIKPDSQLARILDENDEAPVLLEMNGKYYRLVEELADALWVGYDPEKVKVAIDKTKGSWSEIDADQFISDLYKARDEGSRPVTRL